MTAEVIPIRSRAEALSWGEKWQRYAERMEMLAELAQVRADLSEALLRDAMAELERVMNSSSTRGANADRA